MTDVWYQSGRILNIIYDVPAINVNSLQQSPAGFFEEFIARRDTVENATGTEPSFLDKAADAINNFVFGNSSDLTTFDGLMNFTIGIMNGSGAADPTVMDTCRDSIVNYWLNDISVLLNQTMNFEIGALYTLYEMGERSDTIAHDCYSGVVKAGEVYYGWGQRNGTSETMATNFLFNFGKIFDNMRQVGLYFMDTAYIGASSPLELGTYIGDVMRILMDAPAPAMKPQPVEETQ